ncbi:MAG: hypothetical protein WB678_12655 [Stellaceae bacterium]
MAPADQAAAGHRSAELYDDGALEIELFFDNGNDAIVASRSWRVTGPMRAAGQLLRGSFALARRRT